MITQTYDLNLIPEYGSVPVIVHVSQYDSGARTLVFNLLCRDMPFSVPTGATVTIEGTKPDGHSFSYLCDYDGTQVSANVTLQMCACEGDSLCEIRILDNTGILGTANFILRVEVAGVSENPDMSDTDLPAIITIATRQMEAAARSAEEADTSATEAESYARGGTDSRQGEDSDNAKYYAEQAAQSAEEATGGGSDAHTYATLAKSWAIGNTNSRTGENTDNSKYYSEQSASSATASSNSATLSESYTKGGTNSRTGEDTDNSKYYSEQSASSATASFNSAEDSADSATLSESWAIGETNTRTGENTNNSKFYAEQSADSAIDSSNYALAAEGYADDAEETLDNVITAISTAVATNLPIMMVDPVDGHLYWSGGRFTFNVDNLNGHLLWEVA